MIQQHEITAWLGPAANELTAEQRDHFTDLITTHEHRIVHTRPDYGTDEYHQADYDDEDHAAWVAAFEIATGIFDLDARGRAMTEARTAAYQGAIMATLDGTSEVSAAEDARISRLTLRKALGK